ncbi:acyltransferase family protein [Streptomyces sp. NPDC002574]|uniref:acyltransferase family protein n=1 Tax=Streptomyces sp. NPDC002574 TaxID=3364652 RepID=UPI0036912864
MISRSLAGNTMRRTGRPLLPAPRTAVPAQRRAAGGKGQEWRPDIQGLRAVAVTMVVLAHCEVPYLAGGYAGVDVFFVMSGFLITTLLLREVLATGTVSLRTFYARRALRLLPASTIVVLVTLAGAWLFLSKIRFTEYVGDALGSSLYAVNFRLAAGGTDYFAQSAPPSPFQHFWSLAVEEQFYLLWPLLLLAGARCVRRRRHLALPLVALCLVSFGLSVWTTQDAPSWAYFGFHTRAWELGAGALTSLAAVRLRRLPARWAAPMTWAGLGGVLLSAVAFDANTVFPGYHALLPVLGAVLVLAGGCARAPSWGARALLARRPMTWLGGLSYGWYLWHWPLLVIGPMALGVPASPLLGVGLSAGALLLAWLTLRLVENRVRFHKALRRRPGRGLALGAALTTGAVVATLVAAVFPPPVDSGAPALALEPALTAAPDAGERLSGLLDTAATSLPSNLRPALADITSRRSAVYEDGCHLNYVSTATPPCVYGEPGADRTVVLFGDSHAAQWFPALDRLAKARHWKLVSLTKASCKVAEVTTVNGGGPYSSCDQWRAKAVARINALHPALVIASSSDAGTPDRPADDPLRQWTAGFEATYRALAQDGTRVVALLDTPWPQADAVDCAAAHPLHLDRCANHLPGAIRDPARGAAIRTAAQATGATVLDPTRWFCTDSGTCPVVVGDVFVYRDESHMADAYAEALAPVLGDRLSLPAQ